MRICKNLFPIRLSKSFQNAWFQASAIKKTRSALFWDITQRVEVIPNRCFGTTYRSHRQGSRKVNKELSPHAAWYSKTALISSFHQFQIRWYTVTSACNVRVQWSSYRPGVAQRVGRGIPLLFHDRGTRRGWVVSCTPRPHFTPGKAPVPVL